MRQHLILQGGMMSRGWISIIPLFIFEAIVTQLRPVYKYALVLVYLLLQLSIEVTHWLPVGSKYPGTLRSSTQVTVSNAVATWYATDIAAVSKGKDVGCRSNFDPSRPLYTQDTSFSVNSSLTAVCQGVQTLSTDIFEVKAVNLCRFIRFNRHPSESHDGDDCFADLFIA